MRHDHGGLDVVYHHLVLDHGIEADDARMWSGAKKFHEELHTRPQRPDMVEELTAAFNVENAMMGDGTLDAMEASFYQGSADAQEDS